MCYDILGPTVYLIFEKIHILFLSLLLNTHLNISERLTFHLSYWSMVQYKMDVSWICLKLAKRKKSSSLLKLCNLQDAL